MSISVPESDSNKTEKALAILIGAQYTIYDSRNVIGHTEIPKKQIPALVQMMTLQETLRPLATSKMPQRKDYGYDNDNPDREWLTEAYVRALEEYSHGKEISTNDIAMLEHIANRWVFSFGLAMRSVDRKIRAEGVKINTAAVVKQSEEAVGVGEKVLTTLGLGRLTKHKRIYTDKE